MLGKCKLLKIYVCEDSKYKNHNLYHEIVHKLKELGAAGVTVSRGIEGYGKSKALHSSKILDISQSLPIIIEVIDEPDKIDLIIPELKDLLNEGLMFVTEVDVIKYGKNEL